jgi:hypothetical protein
MNVVKSDQQQDKTMAKILINISWCNDVAGRHQAGEIGRQYKHADRVKRQNNEM